MHNDGIHTMKVQRDGQEQQLVFTLKANRIPIS